MTDSSDRILLAHGGGGRLMDELIHRHILPSLGAETSMPLSDSAAIELPGKSLLFTTDSYVVKPLFFNGGDIGKLAVCGTVNDLAVAGARPLAISLAIIVEEGLELDVLEKVLDSVGETARAAGVDIATGDTKTVEAGAADKIFINTAGIGAKLPGADPAFGKIRPGDKILINGTVGDHGMTIMSQRKDIRFESQLTSDCAALADLTVQLFTGPGDVRFMRDPTRGGVAATLNEIAAATGCGLTISESDVPVGPTVRAAAEMLGFDVLTIANEGKFIAVVSAETAEAHLAICRNHPLGKDAAIIGQIGPSEPRPIVELTTKIGGKRIVPMPYGRELPRIC